MIILMSLIGILLAVGLIFIVLYNTLIRKRNECEESWSGIDIQMKRRYDLIPNLVETVKGYATHEKETLEKVTQARTAAMNAGSLESRAEAENMLTGALKSIFALSESYPDLKANQNFLHLQQELTDTEDKIQAARRFYNNAVKSFNTTVETVPTNIVANMFGFQKREFFALEEGEKEAASKPVETKF